VDLSFVGAQSYAKRQTAASGYDGKIDATQKGQAVCSLTVGFFAIFLAKKAKNGHSDDRRGGLDSLEFVACWSSDFGFRDWAVGALSRPRGGH
jgi:hypothetical protein